MRIQGTHGSREDSRGALAGKRLREQTWETLKEIKRRKKSLALAREDDHLEEEIAQKELALARSEEELAALTKKMGEPWD